MEKGVLFETYVHKSRIQARDQLLHLAQVQVAHGKTGISLLMVQLHQLLIFQ